VLCLQQDPPNTIPNPRDDGAGCRPDIMLFGGTTTRTLVVLGTQTRVESEAVSSTNGEFSSTYGKNNRGNLRDRHFPEGFYSPQQGVGGNKPWSYNHQLPYLWVFRTPPL